MHVSTFLGSGTSFRSDQAIFADGGLGCGACPCRMDALARLVVVACSPSRASYAESAGSRFPTRLGSGARNDGSRLPRRVGPRERKSFERCGGIRMSLFLSAYRAGRVADGAIGRRSVDGQCTTRRLRFGYSHGPRHHRSRARVGETFRLPLAKVRFLAVAVDLVGIGAGGVGREVSALERFEFFCSRVTVCRESIDSSAGTPTLQLNVAAPSPAPKRRATTAFLKRR